MPSVTPLTGLPARVVTTFVKIETARITVYPSMTYRVDADTARLNGKENIALVPTPSRYPYEPFTEPASNVIAPVFASTTRMLNAR